MHHIYHTDFLWEWVEYLKMNEEMKNIFYYSLLVAKLMFVDSLQTYEINILIEYTSIRQILIFFFKWQDFYRILNSL